ncbi:hypothetical protein PHISCL_03837 [Aspergillus sclerotialis]|uniref:xyloglucan-specific endo-beta-1,4-glucanase n=1 Tax=Aspergillus sclerotialis TaxID=2070753 RepID=A0A3A2ZL80_9EURO|nr:hypothetical protein PHISCL_03837 [Aspergillus sclerotialis]
MKLTTLLPLIPLLTTLPTTWASPTKSLTRRADSCEQWATTTTGPYIVYNNLWGQDSATSGKQCTGIDSVSGDTISWHTTWSWEGASSSVKSFANAALQFTPKKLSEVNSLKTGWEWSYTGTSLTANVAYDLFLSSTASGSAEYEIMIWLAALGGAGPISSTGSPIANVNIAGVSWDLYNGMNGDMNVFSFVAGSRAESFEGDLVEFFDYLEKEQNVDKGLFLTDVQAGTEPFTGQDAKLTVKSYVATVA